MPKARTRHTCTQCSLRRQQCDRRSPCGRCIKRGVSEKCQVDWPEDYDPAKHRIYPSRRMHRASTVGSNEAIEYARPTLSRQRYVFTPYVQRQLRNATSNVSGASNSSLTFPTEDFLQSLLPSVEHIWKLVDYHEEYLLWYHVCYHGPTFRSELENVLAGQHDNSGLNIHGLNFQWLALLFSIMTGSLTCTAEWRLRQWGFSRSETAALSVQWYKAVINCLNQGEWTSDHDMYSVQAITTLTMSAHALGRSAELSVLLGGSLKVAQALGLDQLDHNESADHVDESSDKAQRHRVLQRDLGRKVWSQLCVQDWMSLPLTGSHSVNPVHFTSRRPSSRDHLTMEFIPESFPTYVSYGNYLFDIAKLVVQHHDATLQSTTPFTKYQHVLEFDVQMRSLATKDMPRYFHVTEPLDHSWPDWVHWARSSLTVCFAHKMIMIHRDYIARSFTESAYSKTRVTCVAAAKTILNEANQARDKNGPVIWIDKGFCVAAALILCVDISHRPEIDAELVMHRDMVQQCIEHLELFENSVIATNGKRLLTESLDKVEISTSTHVSSMQAGGTDEITTMDDSSVLTRLGSEASPNLFPSPVGFSNKFLFDDLLSNIIRHG